MEKEVWTSVVGYGDYNSVYEVSNYGNVRRKNGRILTKTNHRNGYDLVALSCNNKQKRATVHRIVALAFIENPHNKPQVNHKDGNKKNNSVHNLEWVTLSENMRHAWDNGLMNNGEWTEARRELYRKSMSLRFKVKKLSEEHRLKVIASNIGKDHRNKNRADFIHVRCLETNEDFTSIKFAADKFGIKKEELWRHLRLNKSISIPFTFIITRDGTKKGCKTLLKQKVI